tara:strand:+ start:419 stop:775 length:357 start_codon:yes stop_codon:yes gene_type:complete
MTAKKKTVTIKYSHPMILDLGFKKITIVQRSLAKEGLYGCVELSKGILTIDPNQPPPDYKGTLLHEICHVGFDLFGLGDDDEMPQMGNEFLTTVTSNMIQLLWGLNLELFEFIFSKED